MYHRTLHLLPCGSNPPERQDIQQNGVPLVPHINGTRFKCRLKRPTIRYLWWIETDQMPEDTHKDGENFPVKRGKEFPRCGGSQFPSH
jgi:hypothetical protein